MAYTTHGHHIKNTNADGEQRQVARCGGPGLCNQCSREATRAYDGEFPNLGLATTEDLLNELRARIELDYHNGGGGLQYTTMHGRPDK